MDVTKSFLAEECQKLCNFMERETFGAELVIYCTSGLMLLVAYAKRKPTYLVRHFRKPSHIPDCLIYEGNMQTGFVRDIQQKGPDTFLLVSCRPLIPFFMSNKHLLPMRLPGVRVNGNGVSWLRSCLVGREAIFMPLNYRASDKYTVLQLCMLYSPKGNRLLDISETLLKLRFAHFAKDVNGSAKKNAKYYNHLADVESTTKVREALLNQISHYPRIWKAFFYLKTSLLPKEKLLPELLR